VCIQTKAKVVANINKFQGRCKAKRTVKKTNEENFNFDGYT